MSGHKLSAESLQFLDVETGREIGRFAGDSEIPTALAFTPDGRRLVIGTDASLKFWDTASGKLIFTIPGAVARLQFTPDGTGLVVQRENGIAIFETSPPPPLQPLPADTNLSGDPPLPTEASPGPFPKPVRDILNKAEERIIRKDIAGAYLFAIRAAEMDAVPDRLDHHRRSIGLYRQALPRIGDTAPSVERTPLLPEKSLEVQCQSTFSTDGATIYFIPNSYTARPHAVRRVDVRSGRELGSRIPVDGFFNSDTVRPVAPTRDGNRIVVQPTRNEKKGLERWITAIDLSGRPAGPRIELPPFSDKRTMNGRKLLSVTGDGKYAVLDLILRPASGDESADIHPERTLAWELATGKELVLPTRFHRLAFSPDGRFVLAAWNAALEPTQPEQPSVVYDLTTMKPVGEPIALPKQHDQLFLSRNGQFVVATDRASQVTLRVFDVATGRCTLARKHTDDRLAFDVSPAGDLIVMERESYQGKGAIEIRHTSTGKLTQTGTTLPDSPRHLRFSPDGRFVLVKLFWDGTRQLVDTALTEPVGPPLPCVSSVSSDKLWWPDVDTAFVDDALLTRAAWPKDRYLTQTQFHRWDLKAGAVNLAEERERAELLAGRVIDSAGELAAIPLGEYQRRWKQARSAHPDWFAATAADEPKEVPTAPSADGHGKEKPARPNSRADYAAVFARHGGADRPPMVSIADALQSPLQGNRLAAIDYLVFTRPDDRRTLDLLAEGFKDAALRSEIENRFEQMGATARPVAGVLVEELATQWRHGTPSKALVRALGKVGPAAQDAVPVLREYLASIGPNSYSDVETEAVRTLGRIGPAAMPALPELMNKVPKLGGNSRAILIRAVERIAAGREADMVPHLAGRLAPPKKRERPWRATPRESSCEFIAHFGPKLKGMEPALRNMLVEPVPKDAEAENAERVAAIEALWRVTGQTDEALSMLDAELKRRYFSWPSYAVTANGRAAAVIGRIGEPAKKLLPSLEAAIQKPNNLHDRIEIAEAIWRLSGKPDAFLAAARMRFEEKTRYGGLADDQVRTIRTLGEIGPGARDLVPVILNLAKVEIDREAKNQGFKFTIVRTDEEDPDPNLEGKMLPVIREALRRIDPESIPKLEPKN